MYIAKRIHTKNLSVDGFSHLLSLLYVYGMLKARIVFRNTHRLKSFFPYKNRYKSCWDRNDFCVGKQSVDCMLGRKLKISTGYSIYLHDHKVSLYCEIKKIRDLQAALNQNVFPWETFFIQAWIFLDYSSFTLTAERSLPKMYVV